ncbi:multicopper oxidase family protein [Halovulum sp. GXIMD14794]
MKRRSFIATGLGALATPAFLRGAFAAEPGAQLPIPDVWDLSDGAKADLVALAGRTGFLAGRESPTIGYSQSYLGPVLRIERGTIARPRLRNDLEIPVTAHWHGLHVSGAVDGGPQLAVTPGKDWSPELEIDQPEATLWYHSHIHEMTGPQVYFGLAGMMLVTDPDARGDPLPSDWGVDDIPLIIQDRAFDGDGRLSYSAAGPNGMMGFRGAQILVNGAIRPNASVARGLVRLRILNGSNARIYHLAFEDGRRFQKIASDAGYLTAPMEADRLTIAPAERVELLVDFSDGISARLVSAPDTNAPMMGGGMMGRMMGGTDPEGVDGTGRFEVLTFSPDRPPSDTALPTTLPVGPGRIEGDPIRRRVFDLNMHGPGGMMGGGGMGGMRRGGRMGMALAINGQPYDMNRIDAEVREGDVEIWEVRSDMMQHPFHVHGTSFEVLTANGGEVDFASTGLKDVALVDQSMEIKVRFDRPALEATPYMLHCHILEHEDAGMMAQLVVKG